MSKKLGITTSKGFHDGKNDWVTLFSGEAQLNKTKIPLNLDGGKIYLFYVSLDLKDDTANTSVCFTLVADYGKSTAAALLPEAYNYGACKGLICLEYSYDSGINSHYIMPYLHTFAESIADTPSAELTIRYREL